MSATRQIVRWCLGKACGLRTGAAITDPPAAITAVQRARSYGAARDDGERTSRVIGDVCVTSYTHATVPARLGKVVARYPAGGFVISEALREVGGAAGVEAMCGACPANLRPGGLAGCVGAVYQLPDSESTQEQLERIFAKLGIAEAMSTAFLRTNPIWYGLWARSPLSREAAGLLRVLLEEMHREDAEEPWEDAREEQRAHLDALRAFLRAASLAEAGELPLHVDLAPPGHVDFGYRTVFEHCPVCKAPHPGDTCQVCGAPRGPRETRSMERMEPLVWLRDVLGDRFPDVARAYLLRQCFNAEDADEIVALTERGHRR
jgi:hypothetical protein